MIKNYLIIVIVVNGGDFIWRIIVLASASATASRRKRKPYPIVRTNWSPW